MDTAMGQAAPLSPSRTLPTFSIKRMLEMTATSCRFKVELVITGIKNSNLAGEPVPYKPEWQHHLNITVLSQDSKGDAITVEVSNDDSAWMEQLLKRLVLGKTVVIEQPLFSGCKLVNPPKIQDVLSSHGLLDIRQTYAKLLSMNKFEPSLSLNLRIRHVASEDIYSNIFIPFLSIFSLTRQASFCMHLPALNRKHQVSRIPPMSAFSSCNNKPSYSLYF
jgi:hypothetical protein